MCARIDVGIDAHGNRSAQVLRARDAIDVFQLRFALDVEAVYMLIEGVLDFLTRLAHAGERALGRITTRRQDAMKLAAGNDVKAGSGIGQQL